MNTRLKSQHLDKLKGLYQLREERALQLIREQESELLRVQKRRDEQQQLIASLRQELDDLHARRSSTRMSEISVRSLTMESDRRHWLTRELEQEVFYLPGFLADVEEAEGELKIRRYRWRKIRDHQDELHQSYQHVHKAVLRKRTLSEEAALDGRVAGRQHG